MTNLHRAAGRPTGPEHGRESPRPLLLATWLVALALGFSAFIALGVWQLQRLQWKEALVDRVDSRIHAAAIDAPRPADWPGINTATHEYLHVRLTGNFLSGHDTRVQAVTELGGGFWLLSPFRRDDGSLVLVNRGFVPEGWRGTLPMPTEVTGLLRLSETGGGFLRQNDPAAGRWYSRDVAAIADTQGLTQVAPYFVDAGLPRPHDGNATLAAPGRHEAPHGGLTVVRFSNNHLGYALTWFVLALMCAGAAVFLVRDARLRRTGKA